MIQPLEAVATILIEHPEGWSPIYAFYLEIPGQHPRTHCSSTKKETLDGAITESIGYVLSNLELFPSTKKLYLWMLGLDTIDSERVMKTVSVAAEMGIEVIWCSGPLPELREELARVIRERTGKC